MEPTLVGGTQAAGHLASDIRPHVRKKARRASSDYGLMPLGQALCNLSDGLPGSWQEILSRDNALLRASRAVRRRVSFTDAQKMMILAGKSGTFKYAQAQAFNAVKNRVVAERHRPSLRQGFSASIVAPPEALQQHNSYKFDGEMSFVHFERRITLGKDHQCKLHIISAILVASIGVTLAALAAGMNAVTALIQDGTNTLVDWAVHGGFPNAGTAANVVAGYAVLVIVRSTMIAAAALLVLWAPLAAQSGLPTLKSFLNGTNVSAELFSFKTFVAKTLGITLVVAAGMPLGREGPMVHIGAMAASLITRLRVGPMSELLELRLPQPQREWIGMGAAAGVAAAFNAPFGGILFSVSVLSCFGGACCSTEPCCAMCQRWITC